MGEDPDYDEVEVSVNKVISLIVSVVGIDGMSLDGVELSFEGQRKNIPIEKLIYWNQDDRDISSLFDSGETTDKFNNEVFENMVEKIEEKSKVSNEVKEIKNDIKNNKDDSFYNYTYELKSDGGINGSEVVIKREESF